MDIVIETTLNSKPNPIQIVTIYYNSSETKPTSTTIGSGSVAIETDTQKVFLYDRLTTTWSDWT